MGRTPWCCRNPGCPVRFGAALGSVTPDGALELAEAATQFAVHVDLRRTTVRCPACGRCRDFRGGTVYSAGFRGGSA